LASFAHDLPNSRCSTNAVQGDAMIVDRQWAERNLGFDPLTTPAPLATFSTTRGAQPGSDDDLRREIIDFDSEAPHGREFLAFSRATGLSRYTDVPWPKGLAPKTGDRPRSIAGSALPRADVLIVTWTVDEGHALSRVLTPGKDSRDDYVPYTHNYAALSKKMRNGCPAREAHRLGAYWTTTIGRTSVVVFKSDSHMSQDGPLLPNRDVWRQIIEEVQPGLVITTGTAGGIGKEFEVGDVIVSPVVRFDCISKFKKEPFAAGHYASTAPRTQHLAAARKLFKANAAQLPVDNTRLPNIVRVAARALASSVVTTDFFGFDTSDDHYHLQGLGYVSEMGDAVLGLVCSEMGAKAPRWIAVRNVSDPEIKADGATLRQQAALAAQIYKGFGRWSSVCSAIVCWALIAAE
jgi:nucleoside phosphorylase